MGEDNADHRGAFLRVEYFDDDEGQGYYTAVYQNGQLGPRSEGYEGGKPAARAAAERDFPGLPVVEREET